MAPIGLDPVGRGNICRCYEELMGMCGKGMSGLRHAHCGLYDSPVEM